MLTQKLLASTGGVIEYVGSVTKLAGDGADWNSSGGALNVLSIAQTGDLVVIAFTFATGADSSWSWVGMEFTDVLDATAETNPGGYVGYRIVQSGDTNPYVSGITDEDWYGGSIVASVFRGAATLVGSATALGGAGLPNAPTLTATAGLWVATGHLDDDGVALTAPTNYTLAANAFGGFPARSSTAIAYRIANLSSDDPGAFGGTGDDSWRATTMAFN